MKIRVLLLVLLLSTALLPVVGAQRTDTVLQQTLPGIVLSDEFPAVYRAESISLLRSGVIEKTALTSPEEALNGTLTGVYSLKNGGQAFGERNYSLLIRGKATIASAAPLILIDHIEGNIDLLDAAEIASIRVLKDAVALAMYGMRGANGVILITTKRGGGTSNGIALHVSSGIQSPAMIRQPLDAYRYTTLYNEALTNDGGTALYDPNNYLDPDFAYPDVDFANQFLKNNSTIQRYHFEASGGNKVARYYAFAGYTKQDGLFALPEDQPGANQKFYERFNFRTNVDVELGAGFSMNTDVMAAFDYNRSPWINSTLSANASSDYLINTLLHTPANAFTVTNEDGSLGGTSVYRDNPQGILLRGRRVDEHKMLTARVKLNKDLSTVLPGLNSWVQYHFENYNSSYVGKYKGFAIYEYNPGTGSYNKYGTDDTKTTIVGGETSGYYRDQNVNAGLSYEYVKGASMLNALLMYQYNRSNVSGDVPDYVYQGTGARVVYGYNKRYILEASALLQGSNSFAPGRRTGVFPAAGLSWVVSEEPFVQELHWINHLKVYGTWGKSGHDKVSGNRFAYRQSWYAGSGYGFGNPNTTSDGTYEGTLPNRLASWEKSTKTDVGIDAVLFKELLSVSATLFYERRSDIMVPGSNSVPSLIGIGVPYVNGGIIDNKGIEVTVGLTKQLGKAGISAGANFLFARNTIIDLQEMPYEYPWLFRKGNSIDTRYGLVADGLYNSDESLVGAPASAYALVGKGDLRYVNQNPSDDQLINELDKVAIGQALPDIIYGFNFGIRYGGFDLHCYAEGAAGYQSHIVPSAFSEYAYDNRWYEGNSNATYPRLSRSSTHNSQVSTHWQQDAAFFSIQSAELGYALPSTVVNRYKVRGLRVYLKAHQPVSLSTEREGRNHEAPQAGYTEYPLLRTFSAGITLQL